MKRHIFLTVLVAILLAFPVHADELADGFAAYHRGDFSTAMYRLLPYGEAGKSEAQFYLGLMYENGQGVRKSLEESAAWYLLAAEQGHAGAQSNLGTLYEEGDGVPKSYSEALRWYRQAAKQGLRYAQYNLAEMYRLGRGVDIDLAEARVWYRKAAAQGHKKSVTALLQLPVMESSRPVGSSQKEEPKDIEQRRSDELVATGSGFIINRQGHVLTNNHVIAECSSVRTSLEGRVTELGIVARDPKNDLAVVKLPQLSFTGAHFREGQGVRTGDSVVVVGFPLHGLLASEANVTTGTISALAGLGNDTRLMQITAPVQPGNSGGPLLDQSGNIVGMVVSKLNTMQIAKVTGDIPQNINFGINALMIKAFLDAAGIQYDTASSAQTKTTAEIATSAKKYTVLLECHR